MADKIPIVIEQVIPVENPRFVTKVEAVEELEPFEVRANRVLATAFGGLHHVPRIVKHDQGHERYEMWEVNTWDDLSTWDFNILTVLVIMAHDQCVRLSICHSGPRMVKIRMWPRKRHGGITERHPTIEEAIDRVRKRVLDS